MNDFIELKRQGLSIKAISAATGFDRKTVRKYVAKPDAIPAYPARPPRPGKLEVFKPYLQERLQAGVWNAVVLLRELKGRSYTGGYTILKDWLRPQRSAASVVVVRRFETPSGRQAQVDWGHLGSLEIDGVERKLWGFTFTLGHSRAMMAAAALEQKLGTLLRMHEEAFRQLGGVPEEILYDRMKTVWQEIDERGEVVWNPVFLDFARYWGFKRIRQTKPVFDIERVPISRRNRSARFFARWMRLSKVGHRVGCESNQVQAGEVSAGACSPGCRREARQFLNLNVCEAGRTAQGTRESGFPGAGDFR